MLTTKCFKTGLDAARMTLWALINLGWSSPKLLQAKVTSNNSDEFLNFWKDPETVDEKCCQFKLMCSVATAAIFTLIDWCLSLKSYLMTVIESDKVWLIQDNREMKIKWAGFIIHTVFARQNECKFKLIYCILLHIFVKHWHVNLETEITFKLLFTIMTFFFRSFSMLRYKMLPQIWTIIFIRFNLRSAKTTFVQIVLHVGIMRRNLRIWK